MMITMEEYDIALQVIRGMGLDEIDATARDGLSELTEATIGYYTDRRDCDMDAEYVAILVLQICLERVGASLHNFAKLCESAASLGDIERQIAAVRLYNVADHMKHSERYWALLKAIVPSAFPDPTDTNSIVRLAETVLESIP